MSILANKNAITSGGNYLIERSLRFQSASSQSLSRTFSAGTQTKWTLSVWVKRGTLARFPILNEINSATNNTQLNIRSDDVIHLRNEASGTVTVDVTSDAVFRDPSAWYHIVFVYDSAQAAQADRAKLYVNGASSTLTQATTITLNETTRINGATAHSIGYDIQNAVYADGYMAEYYFIDNQALLPTSFGETDPVTGSWIAKPYTGTYGTNGFYLKFNDGTGTSRNYLTYSELIGGTNWGVNAATVSTNSIVAPNGSTTATSITGTGVDGFVLQSFTSVNGNTYTFSVWLKATTNISVFILGGTGSPGYSSTSCNLTTSWQRFTVTFTANGTTCNAIVGGSGSIPSGTVVHAWGAQVNDGSSASPYLPTVATAQGSTLNFGRDYSNGVNSYNNWVSTNLSSTAGSGDCWMRDVPSGNGGVSATQPSSNYAVLNPITLVGTGAGPFGSTSLANLRATTSTSNGSGVCGTIPVNNSSSDKWYWEVTLVSGVTTATNACQVGVIERTCADGLAGITYPYNSSDTPTYTNGDTISFAYDASVSTLYCYKNNVLAKTITGVSSSLPLFPMIRDNLGGGAIVADFNFGQRSFAYTPPSGFKALCTANLPAPTIAKANQYMDATIYAGNGAAGSNTTQTITTAFTPDLLWIKNRTSGSANHVLFDSLRGNNSLSTNNVNADIPNGNQAFGTNVYVVVENGGTGNIAYNPNLTGNNYVGWVWDAGSSTVTNTSGTISSQVRANTTAGFSIVTYTGTGANATVGHGLGVAPKMVIVKNRNLNRAWAIYHANLTSADYTLAFDTAAQTSFPTAWNSTAPTSSVFSVGANPRTNESAQSMVAYCFAEISGYSKFGSYTGNGNADGPFVYCGFRPKFVMIKITSSTGGWGMYDTSRNTFNVANANLEANTTSAEVASTVNTLDFVSNGFKLRNTGGATNSSGATYVFMAFAENPFNYSNAR